MNRRTAIAATVGALGACLFGYVGRWFGWYWDSVVVPEPIRPIFIHRGNVNPDYYKVLVVKPDGVWVRIQDQLIPYEEWLKKDVYTRSRAPMTKGEYRLRA